MYSGTRHHDVLRLTVCDVYDAREVSSMCGILWKVHDLAAPRYTNHAVGIDKVVCKMVAAAAEYASGTSGPASFLQYANQSGRTAVQQSYDCIVA